jgi:hypothetical protein
MQKKMTRARASKR